VCSSDLFDPLMNESQGFYDSGTPIVATRNQLAEELGKIRIMGTDLFVGYKNQTLTIVK